MFFIFELWVLNMTSETAEFYILDNLNLTNEGFWFFVFCFFEKRNKTCMPQTQKCVGSNWEHK